MPGVSSLSRVATSCQVLFGNLLSAYALPTISFASLDCTRVVIGLSLRRGTVATKPNESLLRTTLRTGIHSGLSHSVRGSRSDLKRILVGLCMRFIHELAGRTQPRRRGRGDDQESMSSPEPESIG